MITIWVNGCFDVLHVGHIELLRYAKNLGDKLVIGVDTDDRIKSSKGELRPINTLSDRITMLKAIRWVDEVTHFNSDKELIEKIKSYNSDIMVVGSDYKNKNIIGSDLVKQVLYFDRIGNYSTTNIINGEL
jgi:D-beta-D-heptose 7-phosphate kinase/D-beta-D-heptose 1-phosphate adenosyltransferase